MHRIFFIFLVLFAATVSAQTRVIVPFPPGGGTDVVARVLFQNITERTGKLFLIENVSGAGGDIGRQRAMRDNVLLFSPNSLLISAHIEKLGFVPLDEFQAVVGVGAYPYLLTAHPSFQINNVQKLRDLAQQHGTINIASAGTSGANHLIIAALAKSVGFPVEPIPHKGTPDAAMTTMSGLVPLMVSGIQGTEDLVAAGKLRALAVTTAKRHPGLPAVPTIQEMIKKPFDYPGWFGIVAPRRYPKSQWEDLAREALISLKSAQIQRKLSELGVTVWALGPREFAIFLQDDDRRWAVAVQGQTRP